MACPEVPRDSRQAGGHPAGFGENGKYELSQRWYGLIVCMPFTIGLHDFRNISQWDVPVAHGTLWMCTAANGCALWIDSMEVAFLPIGVTAHLIGDPPRVIRLLQAAVSKKADPGFQVL
jgi:hypothetical protein